VKGASTEESMTSGDRFDAADCPEMVSPRPVALAEAAYRAVVYADIFDFPLRLEEVHRYLPCVRASIPEVEAILDGLMPGKLMARDGYYALAGRGELAALRKKRASIAAALWRNAIRYGLLMARLPFVCMVAVTGSLAVDNVEPEADIDFLLVATNDRVWTARAMAILLVRWARLRSQVTLCPNYIVSEQAIQFEDTMYNAREIAQMVPLAGSETYERLRAANVWTKKHLPNAKGAPNGRLPATDRRYRLGAVAEFFLTSRLGDRVEAWEMKRKIDRFERAGNSAEACFSADFCKGHFDQHAKEIMQVYTSRISDAHPGQS
jgi:hypothetical protein